MHTTKVAASAGKYRVQSPKVSGFTYLSVLLVMVIMTAALAAAGEVWHVALRREKERELLFAGDQFRRAIESYYRHTPAHAQPYPVSLEDLLKDPRYPSTRRYLRKIYPDPISGSTAWGLVKGPAGEILGVYSQSEEEPIKKTNFSIADRKFEGQKRYRDWVFVFMPNR